MHEMMIEITGTPEEVQKMLDWASRTDKRFFRKEPVNPGHYRLWLRDALQRDLPQAGELLAAIRRNAGVTVSKAPKVTADKTGESEG